MIGMLKNEAYRLAKSDSWIRAQYKTITGRWPQNLNVNSLPASDELKSYLTYLRIKWVHSQKRKG
jgi:hypothetical protein